MKKRRQLISTALIYMIFFVFIDAQTSFIKTFDNTQLPPYSRVFKVFEGADNEIFLSFKSTGTLLFLELNSSGEVGSAYKTISQDSWVTSGVRTDYHYFNNTHIVTLPSGGGDNSNQATGLFVFDFTTQNYWAKRLSNVSLRVEQACITENGYVLATQQIENEPHPSHPFNLEFFKVGMSLMNKIDGSSVWSYVYDLVHPNTENIGFHTADVTTYPDGCFFAINLGFGVGITNFSYFLQINNDGQLVKNVAISDTIARWLNHTTDNQGNVYISGSIPSLEMPNINDGLIMKLDTNYQVVWAKRLHADEFNYFDFTISVDEMQNVYFAYATPGDFPVIAGKLDPIGELLWYNGYAAFLPKLFISKNHEIFITSDRKYFPDGSSEDVPVLMKTNPDGTFDNCSTYAACLEVEDVFLELDTLSWERRASMDPIDIDIDAELVDISTADYCPEPRLPKADFSLPSKICPATFLEADSLKNAFANQVEWHVTGESVDTIIRAQNFRIQLQEAGMYTVEQTIWVLGCSESVTKEVEVVAENDLTFLPDDSFVCEDVFLIKPSLSFSDSAIFQWSNGSNQTTIQVEEGGIYSLNVMEHSCNFTDAITLEFLNELSPIATINLPKDTSVCMANLPLIIRPQCVYTDTFWLEHQPDQKSTTLSVNTEGEVRVEADVNGCLLNATFELSTPPCSVPIYLPNVFSPNNDGVNDKVFPQGKDFEGIQLQVFDRWGSLVFQTQQPPFSWDGRKGAKKLDSATYVLVFTYLNQRNWQQEVVSQDVLLLR